MGTFSFVTVVDVPQAKKVLLALGVLGTALTASAIAFEVLQTQKRRLKREIDENQAARDSERFKDESADFENVEIGEIKTEIQEIKELISKIGEGELKEVANQLRANLVADSASVLVTELKSKIQQDDNLRSTRVTIRAIFGKSEERLFDQVQTLRAQSNTNMQIGCFIAFLGAAILVVSIFFVNSKPTSLDELVFQIVPKLSVVVLIELFAYFFLKMYRSNLSEIRYYQNEITNVEMKKAGVFLAISKTAPDLVLNDLCSTDRNFVMEKDQTTQELERVKVDRDSTKNLLDAVTSLLKKE